MDVEFIHECLQIQPYGFIAIHVFDHDGDIFW